MKKLAERCGKLKSKRLKMMQKMSKEMRVIKICRNIGFRSMSRRYKMTMDRKLPEKKQDRFKTFFKEGIAIFAIIARQPDRCDRWDSPSYTYVTMDYPYGLSRPFTMGCPNVRQPILLMYGQPIGQPIVV